MIVLKWVYAVIQWVFILGTYMVVMLTDALILFAVLGLVDWLCRGRIQGGKKHGQGSRRAFQKESK